MQAKKRFSTSSSLGIGGHSYKVPHHAHTLSVMNENFFFACARRIPSVTICDRTVQYTEIQFE